MTEEIDIEMPVRRRRCRWPRSFRGWMRLLAQWILIRMIVGFFKNMFGKGDNMHQSRRRSAHGWHQGEGKDRAQYVAREMRRSRARRRLRLIDDREVLEAYQRDLEQELAEVAERVRRLDASEGTAPPEAEAS